MKRKAYTITGQSFTKPPDNLPEGFTVEETEADDPKQVRIGSGVRDRLYVEARGTDTVISMHETGSYGKTCQGVYTLDEVRQVRDCLNAILGDGGWTPRVFRATDEPPASKWRWWETKPGLFTYEKSRAEAEADSARQDRGEKPSCTNWTFDQIRQDGIYELAEVTE